MSEKIQHVEISKKQYVKSDVFPATDPENKSCLLSTLPWLKISFSVSIAAWIWW